jgi:hypothetical protein
MRRADSGGRIDVFEVRLALASAIFGSFDSAGEDGRGVANELLELLRLGLGALTRLNALTDLLRAWLFARHAWLLRGLPCRDPRRLAVKSVCASITATQRRTVFEKLAATNAARSSTFAAAGTTAGRLRHVVKDRDSQRRDCIERMDKPVDTIGVGRGIQRIFNVHPSFVACEASGRDRGGCVAG